MINAKDAFELAQERNKFMWLSDAYTRLNGSIYTAAKAGLRELKVSPEKLFIGAENLEEAAEMFCLLAKALKDDGFNHKITENGILIVSW